MVAAPVFANANAWAWNLGHDVKAPFFFKVTRHKNDIQYPVLF